MAKLTKGQKVGVGAVITALITTIVAVVKAKAAPPVEGEFTVTDLIIEPTTVNVGDPVTISVLVTNVGAEIGTKTVTLEVI